MRQSEALESQSQKLSDRLAVADGYARRYDIHLSVLASGVKYEGSRAFCELEGKGGNQVIRSPLSARDENERRMLQASYRRGRVVGRVAE